MFDRQRFENIFEISELGRIHAMLPLKEMAEELASHLPKKHPQGKKPMFPAEGEPEQVLPESDPAVPADDPTIPEDDPAVSESTADSAAEASAEDNPAAHPEHPAPPPAN